MGDFVPTTFGLDAVNTVNGTLEIGGSTSLSVLTLFDTTILSSITTSVIYIDSPGVAKDVTLPDVSEVPVGTKVIIKANTRARILTFGVQQIDSVSQVRLVPAWESVTLYNDGTRWLVLEFYPR